MFGFLKKKQKQIEPESPERHRWEAEPRLGAGVGYEIGVCGIPDCEVHSKDSRYEWYGGEPGIAHWKLTPEMDQQGFKLKEEYFKKYGDYGPGRDRPENTWIHQL